MYAMVATSWSLTSMRAAAGAIDHSPSFAGFSLPALACLGVSTLVAAAVHDLFIASYEAAFYVKARVL